MEEYSTVLFYGMVALLVPSVSSNFAGTGMALSGILKKGETVEQWQKRCKDKRIKSMKEISEYMFQQAKKKTK